MNLQTVVENCLKGLGYELVELDWRAGGQLCVFIEHAVAPGAVAVAANQASTEAAADATEAVAKVAAEGDDSGIKIEDCERVSHQLSHLLLVENIDYTRLEVSSPGLDRPLTKRADFERFVGADISIKLRFAFAGRRSYEGRLGSDTDGRFTLDLLDTAAGEKGGKVPAGKRVGKKAVGKKSVSGQAVDRQAVAHEASGADAIVASGVGSVASRRLTFALDEIERARLVPRFRF